MQDLNYLELSKYKKLSVFIQRYLKFLKEYFSGKSLQHSPITIIGEPSSSIFEMNEHQ